MVTAVVLVHCEIDEIPEAATAIADIDGVTEVYSVAGEVDLVAIVRVREHDDLAQVIPQGIARVSGVERTETRQYSRIPANSTPTAPTNGITWPSRPGFIIALAPDWPAWKRARP